MPKRRRLTKKQTRLLISLAITLLLGGGGAYSQRSAIADFLNTSQPGLYEVTVIDDGDTIRVNSSGTEEKVRLIGVDTPELHHPQKPVQCFAKRAKQFTIKLIGANKVRLVADPEDDNRDLYGRLLRYVYLPDGQLLNLELVKQGYGFAYPYFPFIKKSEFIEAEKIARQTKAGLWNGCTIEYDDGQIQTNPAKSVPAP